MYHDNLWTGTGAKNTSKSVASLACFRSLSARSDSVWTPADGTSPWDKNDTEGNGTFVEGHAPHVFEAGTAGTDGAVTTNTGTVIDTTKNWTPNQWVGYSVKNMNPPAQATPWEAISFLILRQRYLQLLFSH
jgi:hypothetical protein